MSDLFDPRRIIRRHDVPEIFAHGPRMIEAIDGNMIRVTLCVDEPALVAGILPLFRPVVRIVTPAEHYVWNTMAHVEWTTQRGLSCRSPAGPMLLRPPRVAMH